MTIPGLPPTPSSPRRRAVRRGVAAFPVAAVLLANPAGAASAEDQPIPSGPPIEVVVTAPRMEVPLKENPAATTVVQGEELATLPKAIAADEALRLVPGVKVDNQADGERVHVSIRGQGLLTETGIRGIKVLLDGVPLNDPTGFAPDLFDVDWATVKRVEVFRGPASSLYGGAASGGILNIETRDGGAGPAAGQVSFSGGSHGFRKALVEAGGSDGPLNYRVSGSRMQLDGYRIHTAADATNLYAKLGFDLGSGDRLTAVVAGTEFFNENAEGLNARQVYEDPRQPNPDALTYDEYQRTRRATVGITGRVGLTAVSELAVAAYVRGTRWTEAVPSSLDHRDILSPGGSLQYTLATPLGPIANRLVVGADLDLQTFNDVRRPNLGGGREGALVLADQDVSQRGVGVYALDRLELSPAWSAMAGVRNDSIRNRLDDNLATTEVDRSGRKSFSRTTARLGVAWNPVAAFGAYASWAQGFVPPATEGLAANPDGFGGFNDHLVPSTSSGAEAGVRGTVSHALTYDVTVFRLSTDDDFGRYRVAARPLETFYYNAGSSRRWGLEALLGFYPSARVSMELAYTWSHFVYDRVLYGGVTYRGTRLPSSPEHQAVLDAEYRLTPSLMVGVGAQLLTRAYVDPTNATWVGGTTLFDARAAWRTRVAGAETEVLVSGRNLGGKRYVAFAEPDPDGNSYHPGPEREWFLGATIHF